MGWFQRGIALNPWDGYNHLRYAMCLAWLGRGSEAIAFVNRAEQLDPHGYYMLGQIGLFYLQGEKPAAARPCFQRSLKLKWDDNVLARDFLTICENQLRRDASVVLRLRDSRASLSGQESKP